MYIDRRNWIVTGILICGVCLLTCFSALCWDDVPDVGPTKESCNGGPCHDNSEGGGGSTYVPYSTPAPAGPSQEQLRQQREAKDLQDEALDKNDEAYAAYQSGDYARAAQLFEEALDEDPDNQEIQHNLKKAQGKLNRSALSQIQTVADHSRSAVGGSAENAHAHAQLGVDTPGLNKGAVEVPEALGGRMVYHDPVIPSDKRTPEIKRLVSEREAEKQTINQLVEQSKTLNPNTNAAAINKINNKINKHIEKVNTLNLGIDEELKNAPELKPKPKEPAHE